MKQIIKKLITGLLVMALAAGAAQTAQGTAAQAANHRKVLLKCDKKKKTYTKYDVTGDGKPDKIVIKQQKQDYSWFDGFKIYVNGKMVYKFADYYHSANIALWKLKNGVILWDIICIQDDEDDPIGAVFRYRAGKLSKVLDMYKPFSKYGYGLVGSIAGTSGNTVKVAYSEVNNAIGLTGFQYQYTYRHGKLKKNGVYARPDYRTYDYHTGKDTGKKLKAGKKIQTYKKVSGKKKAFTLRAGDIAVADKIYRGKKGMWIRLRYRGKHGWIRTPKKYLQKPLFSNASFVG